jgi:ribosomal-protein-alanine N-acetyltransferase
MFRFADVPISLSGMTRIQGARVYLRAPTMEDWPEWAELRARSRAFLTPWEPTWPDDSLGRDHFRRRLRQQIREWRAGEAYGLFVFLNDKRRLAGGINLSNVRRGVAQAASVGYWMGQPFAGQGLMTDALRAVLPFVFDELRLHRLEAACLPNNEYLRINGQWADHLLFALLRADYDVMLRANR